MSIADRKTKFYNDAGTLMVLVLGAIGKRRERRQNSTGYTWERKNQGFIVFRLSQEDAELQKKFVQQVPVTYPLLTVQGSVPQIYRDIARYPAMFLIDRQGRLQPAPGPDQPFVKVEAAVDALLNSGQ
jgi:peroxiredoxin